MGSAGCWSGWRAPPGAGAGRLRGLPAAPTPPPPPRRSTRPSKPYCETVVRVQNEQTSPQAGQGGVLRRPPRPPASQVGDLVATAPAGDRRGLARGSRQLTDQALSSLAATGGDPNRIDRAELTRLQAQSQPAVERIKEVTAARCGVAFRPPA